MRQRGVGRSVALSRQACALRHARAREAYRGASRISAHASSKRGSQRSSSRSDASFPSQTPRPAASRACVRASVRVAVVLPVGSAFELQRRIIPPAALHGTAWVRACHAIATAVMQAATCQLLEDESVDVQAAASAILCNLVLDFSPMKRVGGVGPIGRLTRSLGACCALGWVGTCCPHASASARPPVPKPQGCAVCNVCRRRLGPTTTPCQSRVP